MKIPLFPLHTVLCPGIVVPLHIFEERYREMTRRCLDTGEPFGVVLIREGRAVGSRSVSTLAGVGAFAEIRRAGRYPDGRYDLLAAGTGRFTIESVDAGSAAYLVADVTPLDDEVGDEPRAERLAATAIGRFVRYLELMRARDGETAETALRASMTGHLVLSTLHCNDSPSAVPRPRAPLEQGRGRGPRSPRRSLDRRPPSPTRRPLALPRPAVGR